VGFLVGFNVLFLSELFKQNRVFFRGLVFFTTTLVLTKHSRSGAGAML